MTDRLQLLPKHRQTLETLLREHLPDVEVWAYGLRVNRQSHDGNNLNMVLRGPKLMEIPIEQLGNFEEAVRESNIPFLVEASDWARLPEQVHREIERNYVVLVKDDGRINSGWVADCNTQETTTKPVDIRPDQQVTLPMDDEAIESPSRSTHKLVQPGEWNTRNIGSLGRIVTGKTPPTKNKRNFGGPYPFITIPDLDGHVFVERSERTLSEQGAHVVHSSCLPANSVMMSCIATIGKCGITTRPSFTNQQINSVIPNQNISARFLYYAFQRLGKALEAAGGGGSVYTNVSKRRFSDIELLVPCDFNEQETIASILGTLDDKIELNRRMNETLEAMARAIFKDWFVDFGPTRTKAEGRPPYLPPEIWNLFPGTLDDENKPMGWSRGILAEIAESPRRNINPADISEDTPYIGLEHMPRRSISLTEWEGSGKVSSNKSVFKRGEFLFGKLRPYFHKVGFASLDGICSTDIVVVAPRESHWSAFTLACLSSDDFVNYADQTSTGTKMPRTSWKTMEQYNIIRPPEQIADVFQNIVQPLFNRVGVSIHKNRTLTQTRDLLLPKLITGELRIKDVENFLKTKK